MRGENKISSRRKPIYQALRRDVGGRFTNLINLIIMIQQDQKQCYFCTTNRDVIDYKEAEMLRKFMSSQAKIYPPRKTGTCAHHQRQLARAIKRARFLALVPYTMR